MNFEEEGLNLKNKFNNLVKQYKKHEKRKKENMISEDFLLKDEELNNEISLFFKEYGKFIRSRKNSLGTFSVEDYVSYNKINNNQGYRSSFNLTSQHAMHNRMNFENSYKTLNNRCHEGRIYNQMSNANLGYTKPVGTLNSQRFNNGILYSGMYPPTNMAPMGLIPPANQFKNIRLSPSNKRPAPIRISPTSRLLHNPSKSTFSNINQHDTEMNEKYKLMPNNNFFHSYNSKPSQMYNPITRSPYPQNSFQYNHLQNPSNQRYPEMPYSAKSPLNYNLPNRSPIFYGNNISQSMYEKYINNQINVSEFVNKRKCTDYKSKYRQECINPIIDRKIKTSFTEITKNEPVVLNNIKDNPMDSEISSSLSENVEKLFIEDLIGNRNIDDKSKDTLYEIADNLVEHILITSGRLANSKKERRITKEDLKFIFKNEFGLDIYQ